MPVLLSAGERPSNSVQDAIQVKFDILKVNDLLCFMVYNLVISDGRLGTFFTQLRIKGTKGCQLYQMAINRKCVV